jgi:hypothetical protein
LSNASTQLERDDQIKRLGQEVQDAKADPASIFTILKFARQEWGMLATAFVFALARGTSFPIFSIIYGQTFKVNF